MFDKIHLWSHPVKGFWLLRGFLFVLFFFLTASISLGVICPFWFCDFFLDLVLEDCMFLGNYSFDPGFSVCWHIVLHNIFLKSFEFLWCQLLLILFHFWLYLFGSSLFFSWWVWLKVCQSCLSFQRTSSWFQ